MRPLKKNNFSYELNKSELKRKLILKHVVHPNLTSHDKRQLNREYFKTFFLPVSPLSSFAGNRVVLVRASPFFDIKVSRDLI
jgi:hypothetical protein